MDGLKDHSKRLHNIKNVKVIKELEKIILELRLNIYSVQKRTRFRLKRKDKISLGTKTIYHLLEVQSQCAVHQNKKKIQTMT